MNRWKISDLTSSMAAIAILSMATMTAHDSTTYISNDYMIESGNLPHEYGNVSTLVENYKRVHKKFGVEEEAKSLFGDMREVSQEERAFIQKRLDSISQPTGVDFWA